MIRAVALLCIAVAGCSAENSVPSFEFVQRDGLKAVPVIFDRRSGCISEVISAYYHKAGDMKRIQEDLDLLVRQKASQQDINLYLETEGVTSEQVMASSLKKMEPEPVPLSEGRVPDGNWTLRTNIGDWICPKPIRTRS